MAYAASDGTCPADHPVSLPEVTFEVDLPGIAGGPDYSLASGGIYSFHGDVIANWNNRVQNATPCSKRARNASTFRTSAKSYWAVRRRVRHGYLEPAYGSYARQIYGAKYVRLDGDRDGTACEVR